MTTDTAKVTREQRYNVRVKNVSVTAQHSQGDRSKFDAEIIDISTSGVKLQCTESVRFQERLLLHITTDDHELDIVIEAEVRWMRADEDGWKLGCHLLEKLPDECLQKLGESGSWDRRGGERLGVEIPATCVKAGYSEKLPVLVTNVSEKGFCFRSNDKFFPGEPIRLFLDEHHGDVIAFPKWTIFKEDEDVVQVGCLVSPKSQRRYRTILASVIKLPTPSRARICLRKICIVLLAIIAGTSIALAVFCS